MNTTATFVLDDTEYTLEMNRNAVRNLERSGFDVETAASYPAVFVDTLFHAALRKNHAGITPQKAQSMLDRLIDEEGYSFEDLTKLMGEMYQEVFIQSETSEVSPKKMMVVKGNKTE